MKILKTFLEVIVTLSVVIPRVTMVLILVWFLVATLTFRFNNPSLTETELFLHIPQAIVESLRLLWGYKNL